MDFLKKNYEKILLALVLLGLTAAVGFLTIYIPSERAKLDEMRKVAININTLPLGAFDAAQEDAALKRLDAQYKLDLVTKHRVFNPVLWQIYTDGRLRKIESSEQMGPAALKLVAINPLYLTVTYVTNRASGYEIEEKYDTAARPREIPGVVHPDSTADLFILRKVEGSTDNPTALVLEFKDPTHEQFTLKADADQPFKKVIAYSADLKYSPDPNSHWEKVRGNMPGSASIITLDGAPYKVIDVGSNSVIVSATANNKHTTIPLSRSSE